MVRRMRWGLGSGRIEAPTSLSCSTSGGEGYPSPTQVELGVQGGLCSDMMGFNFKFQSHFGPKMEGGEAKQKLTILPEKC
jgi:hypothetical protein